MLVAIFCFSLMNVIVKHLAHISAIEIVFFRSLVSLIVSVVLLRQQRVSLLGKNRKVLFLRGFFGTIALVMFFSTLQRMPLASAITLHYTAPIFTALIASVFLGEKLRHRQWFFFGISFVGIFMIKGFDYRISILDFVMAISAAFFAGSAYNCIRKLKMSEHPLVIILYFPLVALPVTGLYCLFFDFVMPQGLDWLYLLAIGLLTQIAQFYMTKAYQREAAAQVAGLSYTGIVYALIFGWLLFDEVIGLGAGFGILLVVVGVGLNLYTQYKREAQA
ncbi:MAG: DMT family transporter [Bernardetiaceae bacterium]|nr:DMT family transporter [Bernardetiaceae bacterium]